MENKLKVFSKLWIMAQIKAMYPEVLFLTAACVCPFHIPWDFWFKKKKISPSSYFHFVFLLILTVSEHCHDATHPFYLGWVHWRILHTPQVMLRKAFLEVEPLIFTVIFFLETSIWEKASRKVPEFKVWFSINPVVYNSWKSRGIWVRNPGIIL